MDAGFNVSQVERPRGDMVTTQRFKESYLVQVAEYATLNRLHDEPAFSWWVPHVLHKREQIISKVKTKYWQRTHKYGIEIPKSIVEAQSTPRMAIPCGGTQSVKK